MDFVKELEKWSAAKIARVLECPERTVYAWKMGDRLPPEWVQKLVLDRLRRVKAYS
jgi:succinate dehydrogenase flavin-adding protein (antitoxin of CptAB toxin-antitoxin module)